MVDFLAGSRAAGGADRENLEVCITQMSWGQPWTQGPSTRKTQTEETMVTKVRGSIWRKPLFHTTWRNIVGSTHGHLLIVERQPRLIVPDLCLATHGRRPRTHIAFSASLGM